MAKKCIICNAEAAFCVKGTSDVYCKDCALEQFGDITYLISVEEQARLLKRAVDEEMKSRLPDNKGTQEEE